jgi:GAF domain-containing protein
MSDAREAFAKRYCQVFDRWLSERDERALTEAYELGRAAVREGLTLLDLASVHHDCLPERLDRESADAVGAFFCEALSASEMIQRVLADAREAAAVERRQAAVLRQLSTFLGDASIAADGSESFDEMLQLVAEHARELIGAERCVARLSLAGGPPLRALASADGGTDGGDARDLDLLFAAIAPPAGSLRLTGAELAQHEPLADPVRGWLAASLTALDGRDIGLVQLFDKQDGDFGELDEAVLVQLAQMASAAVERAQLYRR